ncbi:hypothetical protein CSAL01_10395 [Colletotrichum salicis]|uniref:Major facilitator superfamily (MFS) profile domain-containing protein n=1 Tax=Colletotrichum salicis TaxID=1209931 RepID=A0A135U516_9PEZI|nr:hypothetical protein CSAL01_10395 [Colletotrichum salicis]
MIMTSRNRDHILAARILAYIYIGMELAVVLIYQPEITPQRARGFVVGTYQLSLATGGLVANAVARGTGSLNSAAAYLIPYGLFYIVPVIVIAGICCPRGRNDEALIALTCLRQGSFTDGQIATEMSQIRAGIDHEVEKVIGVNFFLQAMGSIFAFVYGAIFVKQLGFINPFTVTMITSSINIVINVIFFGGSIQTAGLFAMGALGLASNSSVAVKSAIAAMMIVMTTGLTLG